MTAAVAYSLAGMGLLAADRAKASSGAGDEPNDEENDKTDKPHAEQKRCTDEIRALQNPIPHEGGEDHYGQRGLPPALPQ
jgi:hypothetical protein